MTAQNSIPTASPSPRLLEQLLRAERKAAKRAQILVCAGAAAYIFLSLDPLITAVRRLTGVRPVRPKFDNEILGLLAIGLVIAMIIAAAIAFTTWFYRAASFARAAGVPARHPPGFGAATFYIPIISLWMPYQATSDTLPRRYGRAWLRWWWGAWLTGTIASILADMRLRPIGVLVLSVIAIAAWGVAAVTAWRLIGVIGQAHAYILAESADAGSHPREPECA